MTSKMYASITGAIFLIVSVVHLIRVFLGWEFRVDGMDVPAWGSLAAVVVAGYLSFTGFRIAGRST